MLNEMEVAYHLPHCGAARMRRALRKVRMLADLRDVMEHPECEAALWTVLSVAQEKERDVIATWIRRARDVLNALDSTRPLPLVGRDTET